MDHVVLLGRQGRKWLVPVDQGLVGVQGIGKVKTDGLGRLVGRTLDYGGRSYAVLSPSIRDLLETLQRKAQIVGPKDAPFIAFNCSLGSGDLVVEGGSGSGALTLVLAHAVAPQGKVVSYDVRGDLQEVAQSNLERSGLGRLVEFKMGDVCEGIEEEGVKAVVLDIPEPWRAVPAAHAALQPAGHLASFSPTVEQLRETVLALRKHAFVDVWSEEILERRMEVNRGTRPSFDMLGHTGYMTFGRKTMEGG